MKVNDTISGKLPKFVTDPIANGATLLVKKLLWLNVIITKNIPIQDTTKRSRELPMDQECISMF